MVDLTLSQYAVERFLLILMRIATFLYVGPIFSISGTIPRKVKVGFAVVISLMIYPLVPVDTVVYNSVIEYAAIVIKEAAAGLMIGYMANICINVLAFAGQIIDMQIGFAMVSLFDPSTRSQTTITGTIYTYFIYILLLISNMYEYVVRAVIDSFQLIPINGVNIDVNNILELALRYTTDCFVIGFRIVMPFLTVIFVLDVILGVLAKVAPQMNMFVIGMQLKVFCGFTVMIITVMLLPSVSNFIFTEMKTMIVATIKALG